MEPRTSYWPGELIEKWAHKVLCRFGKHKWVWKLSDVGAVQLGPGSIPPSASCKYCGVCYGAHPPNGQG